MQELLAQGGIPLTRAIYSIGHSNHPWGDFRPLLERSDIGCVVDVRSSPTSRWTHFRRPELRARLNQIGIAYLYLGNDLGGHPANGPSDYSAMTLIPSFASGIAQVLEVAQRCRPALLCAEHSPLDCHRFLLVSRELSRRDVPVAHILRDGRIEHQAETEDRLMAMTLGASTDLIETRSERLARAYEQREAKLRRGIRTDGSEQGGSS